MTLDDVSVMDDSMRSGAGWLENVLDWWDILGILRVAPGVLETQRMSIVASDGAHLMTHMTRSTTIYIYFSGEIFPAKTSTLVPDRGG
jgi:hypothetical protein